MTKIDTTGANQEQDKTTEASLQATQSRSLINQAARQVDFYFSDKNYVRDAYMKDLAGRDPARWVDLSEILAFNKMRVLMRGLGHDELIEALKRHLKNAPRCSFEINDDFTRLKKKGLVVLKKPQKKAASSTEQTGTEEKQASVAPGYADLFSSKD